MPVVMISKQEKAAKQAALVQQPPKKIIFTLKKDAFSEPKMKKPKKSGNFKQWYDTNGDDYNRKRREKYANDPEYKSRIRAGAAKWREEHKKLPTKAELPEGYFDTKKVAAILGRNTQAIGHWESNGYIPQVSRDKFGRRIFTQEQVNLLMKLVEGMKVAKKGPSRASPLYRERMTALIEEIRTQWGE